MGKKGKRSRRQAKKVDADKMIIDNVKSRICGLLELTNKSVGKRLFSDAATNLRVAIHFLKTKQTVLQNVNNGPYLLCTFGLNLYRYLIRVESLRANFEAAMEVYNDLKDNFHFLNPKIGKDWLEADDINMQEIQLYYELALVATKDSNSDTSCICKFLRRQMSTVSVDAHSNNTDGRRGRFLEMMTELTENVLREAKKFDEVIDLDKKLLLLPNLQEPLDVKISLVASYMERYREEYHLRSKREDCLLVKNVIECIRDKYEYRKNNKCELSFALALAQWHYLCHKLSDEKHKRICYDVSIRYIEEIIENQWNFKDYCSTCLEAPTKDEVKYVCSGCRVACYCSIDHQRMHWRKNQIPGTCVGHEAFCPVLKAYRKWKVATDKNSMDEEKQERMRRRFERECLHFLGYGLRLEKKCFEPNDVCKE